MDMDSSQSFSNEIKQITGLIWRWAWLLGLLALVGGGLTYYYSSQQPKIYKATATVLIDNPQATSDLYYSVYFTDRLTQTYSQMILQQPTLEGVIEELGLDLSVSKLQQTLRVETIPDTQLLRISIEDTDPNRAAAIVNSIGTVFAQTNAEMQASRYSETKNSLEAQMVSMDQQIQQTSQALELLEPAEQTNPEQAFLQVQLDTYQSIYQETLRKSIAEESSTPVEVIDTAPITGTASITGTAPITGTVAITANTPIEAQMAFVETKISEISADIQELGYYLRGPKFEVLNTQLTAYQNLYQKLVEDFVSSNDFSFTGEDEDGNPETDSLSRQLEVIGQRIVALTEEINATGGGSNGNIERDRLESNLVLYRQTYAGLVQSYEQVRLAEIQNTTQVDVVQPANPPTTAIRPNVMQNAMMGMLVGLIVGGIVVFISELIDDTIKGPWDVVNRMKLPVLGYIPRINETGDYPIAALEPRSPMAESFRSLRTNIQYASIDRPIYTLMITSPTPQDGKSTISANLGVVLAQGKHRVSLIDADLRRPNQHKIFALTNRSGLTDALIQNGASVNGQFKATRIDNLSVLTTGDLPPNPAELVGSDRMLEFIRGLGSYADLVLMDTPPVMAVTDPVVLSTKVDGVILVVRPGLTKLNAAIHAAEQLRQVGANLLGVVFNDVENKGARYSQYYKGYYYQYGKYYDYTLDEKKGKLNLLKRDTNGKDD